MYFNMKDTKMSKHYSKTIFLLLMQLCTLASLAQVGQGALRMVILEDSTGLPVPFANVALYSLEGKLFTGGMSYFDGEVDIRPLPSGYYNIEITTVEYETINIDSIYIENDSTYAVDKNLTRLSPSEYYNRDEYPQVVYARDYKIEKPKMMAMFHLNVFIPTGIKGMERKDVLAIPSNGMDLGSIIDENRNCEIVPTNSIGSLSMHYGGLRSQFENYERPVLELTFDQSFYFNDYWSQER